MCMCVVVCCAQVEPSFSLFVFALSDFPNITKLPATLRIHQGEVLVRLLFLGLVRQTIEEAFPRLIKPFCDLLGNLRVQRLELGVLLSEV